MFIPRTEIGDAILHQISEGNFNTDMGECDDCHQPGYVYSPTSETVLEGRKVGYDIEANAQACFDCCVTRASYMIGLEAGRFMARSALLN